MIANRVLSIKEVSLVVHMILVKPEVMQRLDGINIIIQLKVQNHQNNSKATSAVALQVMSFQMLRRLIRPGRT